MSDKDQLKLNQSRLVAAWQRTLPTTLDSTDKVEVKADESDRKAIRIWIAAAGHSMYTFDFKCTYVDSREVKVELVDVEKEGLHVNEDSKLIQDLIKDYIRDIHECAQALDQLTHS